MDATRVACRRAKEQLIYRLGLLLRPFDRLGDRPFDLSHQDLAGAVATVAQDGREFLGSVKAFTTGHQGQDYSFVYNQVSRALRDLGATASKALSKGWPFSPGRSAEAARKAIMEALDLVPLADHDEVVPAGSAFYTYCQIKDICGCARRRLCFADRYPDPALFYRYLREVSSEVEVALLTWPPDKWRSRARYDAFVDASRIWAEGREPTDYRLVVTTKVHDRWLVADSDLFQLGGSFKDAGNQCPTTLSQVNDGGEALRAVLALIGAGTELFGPAHLEHP